MTIEAVNSVLSNAPYFRAAAEQQSVVNSFAANPDQVQKAPVQAPYVSLYIKVDVNFDKALLQLRDGDTGDVVRQIPSEVQLEAYRRAQEVVAPKLNSVTERSTAQTDERSVTTDTTSASTSQKDTRNAAPQVEVRAPAPTPQQAPAAPIQAAVVSSPAPQAQSVSFSTEA